MKLCVLSKDAILDILHFLHRSDVENARLLSIQWNNAVACDSYNFTAVTTCEIKGLTDVSVFLL